MGRCISQKPFHLGNDPKDFPRNKNDSHGLDTEVLGIPSTYPTTRPLLWCVKNNNNKKKWVRSDKAVIIPVNTETTGWRDTWLPFGGILTWIEMRDCMLKNVKVRVESIWQSGDAADTDDLSTEPRTTRMPSH